MREIIRNSFVAAAVLALGSVATFATPNSTTTTISLTATVGSFDNITCTQAVVDLNTGASITASGLTPAQAINCSVTTNDPSAMDVTAYIVHTAPLTGTTISSNTIANSAIQWSQSETTGFAAFAPLAGLGDGAIVNTSIASGDNTGVSFYLKLNVPVGQNADTYAATMTVAITPHGV